MEDEVVVIALREDKEHRRVNTNYAYISGWIKSFLAQGYRVQIEAPPPKERVWHTVSN